MSGAYDRSNFDGITISVGSIDNENIFIFGFENTKFTSKDKIIEFISLMHDDMLPIVITIREKYTFSIFDF